MGSSLFNKLTDFARGPQGRKVADQAKRFARDPATRRRIDEARRRLTHRGSGPPR